MRASEILHKMADIMDSHENGPESGQSANTEITNRPDQSEVEVSIDAGGIEGAAQVNTRAMISPLQLQAELLKKVVGHTEEEPECCPQCGCNPCGCEPEQDELAIIKQNAGIKPAVIAIADEDEPFEG
jgi:hypothetical protein